jgi:hypothetical protein
MRIMARRNQQAVINTAMSVPPGTPAWITGDLIEATIRVWQPYYNEPITSEVAVEMLIHVGQLLGALQPKGTF